MVFHWSLSDSKSPQIPRTLLSILVVLNYVVVWMVTTRPPTFKFSSPFSNPLVIVPNGPITVGIIVTIIIIIISSSSRSSSSSILLLLERLFHQPYPMVSHWGLNDSKSP